MDALMAALVAGALASVGDRPAWLAAILADRVRGAGVIVAAAILALAGAGGLAATAGALVAPRLTPEAKLLMLALALLLQGGGALFAAKPPDRLDGWRIGGFSTAALGLFILLFGDGLQFIVFALSARASLPALAAVGATLGAASVIGAAALLGERHWLALPLRKARLGASALFTLTGAVLALQALALV